MDEPVTTVLINIWKLIDLCIFFLFAFSFSSDFQILKEISEYRSEIQLTVKYLCNYFLDYLVLMFQKNGFHIVEYAQFLVWQTWRKLRINVIILDKIRSYL